MAHCDFPPVILLGDRDTGKSSLIAGICGVHVGSSTACPVEWTIMNSTTWKGRVAVAYFTSSIFSKELTSVTRPIFLNPERMCSSPAELLLLIRKGEILALSGSHNFKSVMAMDADTVDEAYKKILTTRQSSRGIVYIRLCIPSFETTVKVVDLPGKYPCYINDRPLLRAFSLAYTRDIDHAKSLLRYYLRCREAIVAVLERANDFTENARGLPFLKSITEDIGLDWAYVTLVLSYAADTVVDVDWLNILKESGQEEGPSTCLLFRIPQQRAPFVINDLSRLRRRDEIFLRFRPPWAQGSPGLDRNCFGVSSILESWQAISDIIAEQEVRQPWLELWKYFVVLSVFATFLAIVSVE